MKSTFDNHFRKLHHKPALSAHIKEDAMRSDEVISLLLTKALVAEIPLDERVAAWNEVFVYLNLDVQMDVEAGRTGVEGPDRELAANFVQEAAQAAVIGMELGSQRQTLDALLKAYKKK